MAEELAPGTPEVTDTVLIADLLQFLSIRGSLGRLPLADVVIPVINLGDVRTPDINVQFPVFRSTDIFSAGIQIAPAVGTVLADTVALPAGTYDVALILNASTAGNQSSSIRLEHRDAANAANLAQWEHLVHSDTSALVAVVWPFYSFGYEIGVNERLRAINPIIGAAGNAYSATIFARLRT